MKNKKDKKYDQYQYVIVFETHALGFITLNELAIMLFQMGGQTECNSFGVLTRAEADKAKIYPDSTCMAIEKIKKKKPKSKK